MKQKIFLLPFLFLVVFFETAFSQNVGINTNTPQYRLDVKNGSINTDSLYRLGGIPVLTGKTYNSLFIGKFTGAAIIGSPSLTLNNTYIGDSAGYSGIGNDNTFVGYNAGHHNLGGWGNTLVGSSAGENITSVLRSAIFGFEAGKQLTSGDYNSFFGAYAGYGNNGAQNSFFGEETGFAVSGTSSTCLFGYQSGKNIGGAFQNSFFGAQSGLNNTIGSLNNFFGYQAGLSNTTGNRNAMFGFYAGYYNVDGDDNSFFGAQSGKTNISGNKNLIAGASSGISNTTGSLNTILGYSADVDLSNLNYAVALGAEASVGCSNCLVLGGSTATTRTKIGINKSVPVTDLNLRQQSDVAGDFSRGVRIERTTGNFWRNYIDGSNLLTFEYNNLGSGNWGWITTTGSFVSGSDMRSKKNIVNVETVLDKIMKLQPKKYLFNQQDDKALLNYGFLAQDVRKIFPEFVSEKENGYLGIAYSNFGVIAVKAIQEQQKQLDEKQEQIEELRKEIKAIKQQLNMETKQ